LIVTPFHWCNCNGQANRRCMGHFLEKYCFVGLGLQR
jgi:hypothetical protein